jgi:DNA helicase II / ATP-dependent DNA helicase PcrA
MAEKMKLTTEQKAAVEHEDHLALTSCPGSGKTRTIIAKLVRCLEEIRNTTRRIACITYTNAAVDEVQYRLAREIGRGDLDDYFEISTLHAFCLNNIFRPFHTRIPHFSTGYEILPPEHEEYRAYVNSLMRIYNLDRRAFDDFGQLQRGHTPPYRIKQEAADDFWNFLDSNSYVDFNSIIYYSSQLVKDMPFISSALASKYNWILVDEFQDTSTAQKDILSEIFKFGRTKFFIVGDPEQSIMGFAGGRPDLMEDFSAELGAKSDVSLSGNFRSSERIVTAAETLIPRQLAMKAVGDYKNCGEEPRWVSTSDVFTTLTSEFFPWAKEQNVPYGNCAILAPTIFQFFGLAPKLRNAGIPLIGPGARPYRRSNHLIAPIAEEVCCYIQHNENRLLRIIRYRLRDLILNVEGRKEPRIDCFEGDVCIMRIIKLAVRLRKRHTTAIGFLNNFGKGLASILQKSGYIGADSEAIIAVSGSEIGEDIERHQGLSRNQAETFSIDDLGLFGSASNSIRLLTLHKAKGREFDAVAIIGAEEGLMPFRNPLPRSQEEAEARRVFYVGMTRAKKILMLISERNGTRPSRFLYEAGFAS